MTTADPTTSTTVTSKDGTSIAYERAGTGPALILVDAAGRYREFVDLFDKHDSRPSPRPP